MILILVALWFLLGYEIGQPDTNHVTAWVAGAVATLYYVLIVYALGKLKKAGKR